MEALLSFFSDLILFTFGLAIVTFWIVVIVVIVDEVIDFVIAFRNRNNSEEETS